MKTELLFSLIMPCYNREAFVLKTIATVMEQSYPHFELILVDDGSSDNTGAIVQGLKNPKIRYYKIENSERGAARNYGIKKATGDYISFLDSDDILLPDHFQTAYEMILRYKRPEVVHLNFYLEDGNNNRQMAKVPASITDFIPTGNPFSTNGIFLRADIAKNNLFNEDRKLAASEDYELWTRLAARYTIHCTEKATSVIHSHVNRSVFASNIDQLILRKDLFLKYVFEDEQVREKFGTKKAVFDAYFLSYIALHLVLSRNIVRGYFYLLKAAFTYPPSLFERRTLAIVKRTFIPI